MNLWKPTGTVHEAYQGLTPNPETRIVQSGIPKIFCISGKRFLIIICLIPVCRLDVWGEWGLIWRFSISFSIYIFCIIGICSWTTPVLLVHVVVLAPCCRLNSKQRTASFFRSSHPKRLVPPHTQGTHLRIRQKGRPQQQKCASCHHVDENGQSSSLRWSRRYEQYQHVAYSRRHDFQRWFPTRPQFFHSSLKAAAGYESFASAIVSKDQ